MELQGKLQTTCARLQEKQCRLRRLQGERTSLRYHVHTLDDTSSDVTEKGVPCPGIASSELSTAVLRHVVTDHSCSNHRRNHGVHATHAAVFHTWFAYFSIPTAQFLLSLMSIQFSALPALFLHGIEFAA